MNTQFDNETTPHQQQDGSWTLMLSDQWNIGENPNGGYLIIPALRAMQGREEHPDPLSVTAHFLRPGTGAAPAQIDTEIVRSGRSVTTTRGSLSQNETTRLELIAAFGNLIDGTGHDYEISVPPPVIPSPENCVGRSGEQQVRVHVVDRQLLPREHRHALRRLRLFPRGGDHQPQAVHLVLRAQSQKVRGYVGQRPAVHLAVLVQRELGHGHDRPRHHVGGQLFEERGAQGLGAGAKRRHVPGRLFRSLVLVYR